MLTGAQNGWLTRLDAAEPFLSVAALRDKGMRQAWPALRGWIDKIGDWIGSQGDLEAAKQKLLRQPQQVLEELGWQRFEEVLYQGSLLAELDGRANVLDEPDDVRTDADDWLKQPFEEAVDYFRGKVNLPVETYKALESAYHDWAFSVAHLTQADLLEAARWLVDRAISEGMGFEEFKRSWQRLIGRRGWEANGQRLWTIFDTNIRGAHGAGRFEQMSDPELLKLKSIWVWRWRDSPNPRIQHQKLHNVGIPADHPFWRGGRCPAGFGCRCAIYALSESMARQRGIRIELNPPDPKLIFDPGFREPFSTGTAPSRQPKQVIRDRLNTYSPNVRRYVESALKQRGAL